jgi:hypothetical protein
VYPRIVTNRSSAANALFATVVAFGLVLGSASGASALTTVDGSLPLELVDGSRLIGVESYHPKL